VGGNEKNSGGRADPAGATGGVQYSATTTARLVKLIQKYTQVQAVPWPEFPTERVKLIERRIHDTVKTQKQVAQVSANVMLHLGERK